MKRYVLIVGLLSASAFALMHFQGENEANKGRDSGSSISVTRVSSVSAVMRSHSLLRETYIVQTNLAPWTSLPDAAISFQGQLQSDRLEASSKVRPVSMDPAERQRKAKSFLQSRNAQAKIDWQRYSKILGRSVVPERHFALALTGVAVRLTASEAKTLALQPDIMNVTREQRYELVTDSTPTWVGATEVWAGRTGIATEGQGVTIGIIDSGVLPELSAMTPASTEAADYPVVTKLGICVTSGACNNKLYGMYDFTTGGNFVEADDGRDQIRHGSAVAEVSAGRKRTVSTRVLSGIAPKARIISYKVCEAGTGCPSGAMFSALDQALLDNVQVINFSLGGVDVQPWNDPVTVAILNLRKVGIVPIAAAGNSGPGAATVGYPGSAPWVLSVGATTGTRVGNSYSHDAALADVLWSGSSRGPSLITSAVGKPDMTAPGVSVLWQGATSMWLATGSSMASPHVAGAAALLRAANPTWTVDRIVSSLSTGVSTSVRRDDGLAATGFETGGGRLSLVNASNQGLYLAINNLDGQSSFDAANPQNNGDPKRLNLANMVHDDCQGACTLTRRMTDGAGGSSWRAVVEGPSDVPIFLWPSEFTLASGESKSVQFNITSKTGAAFTAGWIFGRVRFLRTDRVAPDVVLPLSINLTQAYTPLNPMQLVKGVPTTVMLAPGQTVVTFADIVPGAKPVRITAVSQGWGSGDLRSGSIGDNLDGLPLVSSFNVEPALANTFNLRKGRYKLSVRNGEQVARTVVISLDNYDSIVLPQIPKN